jgi:hypothetical protein
MSVVLENNAAGTLAAKINTTDTQLLLSFGDGDDFPTLGTDEFFYATLIASNGSLEIVKVTARVGDTMTVERAQEKTTARSFSVGSRIELRVTVGNIMALIPEPQIIVSSTPPENPKLNQLWLDIS